MSIKWRITLWFTLFMTILAAVTIGIMFYAGKKQAMDNFSRELVQRVEDRAETLDWREGALTMGGEEKSFADGIYLSVYSDQGKLIWGEIPSGFDEGKEFVNREAETVKSGGVSWQVYDARQMIRGKNYVWVRGVMQESGAAAAFDSAMRIALMALPLFVLLAAAGGYLIIHRSLEPVRKITETAESLGKGRDLSRRIGLAGKKDEVYQMATAFDNMLDRLEDAFENEKRFTADASHELRTPIAVIISQCEAALDREETEMEYREALETVLDQGEKMSRVISQLLTLARADRSHEKLHLEEIDFSELTEMVIQQQMEYAASRKIKIHGEIQEGIRIEGDETMLIRLWINLMDNGIKYGREEGTLTVTLKSVKNGVLGSVSDDGEGMAREDLSKVWHRFWQGSSSRRNEGAGLGLSMVKWIVEAHGGRVWVESQLKKGSTFSFFLPFS